MNINVKPDGQVPDNQQLNSRILASQANIISEAQENIIEYYFKERIVVLDIIFFFNLIIYNKKDTELMKSLENLYKDVKDLFLPKLWESFKSYGAKDFQIYKNIESMEKKETHLIQILREQTKIFENMLAITKKQQKNFSKDKFMEIFEFFESKKFTGFLYDNDSDYYIKNLRETYVDITYQNIDIQVLIVVYQFGIDNINIFKNDEIQTDIMPFSLFKSSANVKSLIKIFKENNNDNSYLSPILMLFIEFFKYVKSCVSKGKIKDQEIKKVIDEVDNNFKELTRDFTEDYITPGFEYLINMFNRNIFKAEYSQAIHNIYRQIIYDILNLMCHCIDIERISDYLRLIIILCGCIFENDKNLLNAFSSKDPMRSPLGIIYRMLINHCPLSITETIQLSDILTEGNSNFSKTVIKYQLNIFRYLTY